MLTKEEILKRLREHRGELQQKFPVKDIALFGSYARGGQTPESDIDVLVEFTDPVGLEFIDSLLYLRRNILQLNGVK